MLAHMARPSNGSSSISENSSLSVTIKKATASEHYKVENSAIMIAVMGGQFSLASYRSLLYRMLSFYLPIEKKINIFINKNNNSYNYFPKSSLLQANLEYVCPGYPEKEPKELEVPAIKNHEDFLGVLYVLEGSTLGGSLIHKTLAEHINACKAATFFYPYGRDTKKRWDETRMFIDNYGNITEIDSSKVCDAAISTFQSIGEALNDESII